MEIPAILHNPLIIGSLGLSAGTVVGYLRNVPQTVTSWFSRTFTSSIEVSNTDDEDTYTMVRDWVSSLEYAKKTRNLTAIWDNARQSWVLSPAPGNHILWLAGRPVWLNRSRKQPQNNTLTRKTGFEESITLRVLTRNKSIVSTVCQMIEHHSQSLKIPDGQMRVFNVDYNSWNCAGNRTARCIDSVILPGNEMERITSDLEKFWKNAEWYHNMGIPHRRGWLLQGTPGSGKTSLISALAGRYKRGIHVLSLSEPNFSDAKLADLIARIPAGDMLLMEDVDAAFQQRESKDAGITFSGLLNALDGVSSPDGIVVFMTTNHPEKLDPALIRPGRIDQVMEFHTATDEQLTRLYERFNPSFDKDLFLEKTRGKTIAQAQVALLGHIA